MTWPERFAMPEPKPEDAHDELTVTRIEDGYLIIRVGKSHLRVSEYTAAQILGCLSLFLNIRINHRDAARITLGKRDGWGREEPPPTEYTELSLYIIDDWWWRS